MEELIEELIEAIQIMTDEITAAIEKQNEHLYNIERRLDGIERK
ncbi:hypothetical protein ACKA04_02520 [Helcococcus kunzii]